MSETANKKPDKLAIYGGVLLCLSFGSLVIAFASPYWIQSFEQFHGRFVKIGLWEVCFNDYTFYKDYNGKRYLGCWYLFSDQIRPIWEWISPPWFIVCQVMVSLSLLVQGIIAVVMILFLVRLFPKHMDVMLQMFCGLATGGAALVLFMELVMFAVYKEDRDWIPRPDMNFLSWSYGFAWISFFLSCGATFCLTKAGLNARKMLSYHGGQIRYDY